MASYSLGSAFDKNGTLMNYLYTDADFQTEDIRPDAPMEAGT